ncbi:putative tellurium resistance membrane protein TerC [Pontibacter ummariensis]|uniref:Membrane protein TerC, possibly involved in tellurium resistance n=1 Tax=Pontibacter ummariensis TaxID=1610492 RepID=A0A239IN49_9BACT|nr:TerC family protein [Pontibacter ummariensis]PRY09882.1 putative tellurium resistance membrane protein TerC [Pontibacter ummariensis]SNS93834.1 Membrane protein TerC, possibly involved in tellurium resistance [Pontibacter ummariensis]
MEIFANPDTWISLLTLTFMEVVLGIDNIVFISIVVGRLPQEEQGKGRVIGLGLALVFRVILLLFISWIVGASAPLFNVNLPFTEEEFPVSWRDIILFGGGLFLLAKSTTEIHGKLEGEEEGHGNAKAQVTLSKVLVQIVLIDIVFSFDSILTAVGLAEEVIIMIIAVVFAMIIMLIFAKAVSDFVNKHPTVKMLALSFLILIGVMLIVEALHQHIPKGYIYFAMFFSLMVEVLNMQLRKKTEPVRLREDQIKEPMNDE